jgi:Beta-lactamase enzyme family
MRVSHGWHRIGMSWIAGCATAACAVASIASAPAASASMARPAATAAPHLCHAWTHGGQTRTQLADRLDTDIDAAVHGRGDTYAVRMRDPDLGIECGLNSYEHFKSASVVKATILAALLRKAHAAHRGLTAHEKSLAWSMITVSDNNAATALWNDVGRTALQKFLDLAKMTRTVLGPGGYWGLTLLTAYDETKLLWLLLKPNSVLTTGARDYELSLMANVTSSQRWGTPAGTPTGYKVHVKNGWAPLDAPFWNVNSIGAFTRSTKAYTIVVLTAGNPSMAYGITTIENVAVKIHHDLHSQLAAAIGRSTRNAAWGVPDEKIP